MTATVHVFTFKTGLLSRLAHDLRLRCERFDIDVSDGRVRAHFDPASLRVDGVMRKGSLDPGGLSRGDYDKIEATIRDEVLQVRRHPTIAFEGQVREAGAGAVVAGTLTLAGRAVDLPTTGVRRTGDRARFEVELAPTRWGITPYKALGGTLKLLDRVRIEIELDAGADFGPAHGAMFVRGPRGAVVEPG